MWSRGGRERLLAGDADVVVVSAPPDRPLNAGRFALHHLLDERLLVAVPRNHRLARLCSGPPRRPSPVARRDRVSGRT
jgi:DNA-binding transcriptional LysR family regulator